MFNTGRSFKYHFCSGGYSPAPLALSTSSTFQSLQVIVVWLCFNHCMLSGWGAVHHFGYFCQCLRSIVRSGLSVSVLLLLPCWSVIFATSANGSTAPLLPLDHNLDCTPSSSYPKNNPRVFYSSICSGGRHSSCFFKSDRAWNILIRLCCLGEPVKFSQCSKQPLPHLKRRIVIRDLPTWPQTCLSFMASTLITQSAWQRLTSIWSSNWLKITIWAIIFLPHPSHSFRHCESVHYTSVS